MNEFEVKFLNIDVAKMENTLKNLGAKKEGDYHYHSCSFDFPGFTLDKESAWIRLRDEGDKVMLAYKQRLGVKSNTGDDEGMREIEVKVENFEMTKQFLLAIGLIVKFEQEKKRVRWTLDDVEFDFDTWPKLETYLEIEADNEEDLWNMVTKIGLDKKDAKRCSATQVYEMNGIRDKDYIKMTFDEFVKR